jgi:hypothetical protein
MKRTIGDDQFHRAAFLILFTLALMMTGCSVGQESFGVGQPAPNFSLPTAGGGTVALNDYVSKQPVLLYFHMAVG